MGSGKVPLEDAQRELGEWSVPVQIKITAGNAKLGHARDGRAARGRGDRVIARLICRLFGHDRHEFTTSLGDRWICRRCLVLDDES
jgi:hypothetical protein